MSATEILEWAILTHGTRFGLLTSFQAEGMVLIDLAVRLTSSIRVVSLDTGRLPVETGLMMQMVESRYGIQIERVEPEPREVDSMVTRFGRDLFYEDVALRNLCCQVRKTRPLNRKLGEFSAYAVGLRREQSESRREVTKAAESHGKLKLSPLCDWSKEAVWDYIRRHDVPVHPLYAAGYRSIGCAPCSRALAPGEDERAGRWWWEMDAAKECGLHFLPDGRAQRRVDVLLSEIVGQ